MDTYRRNRVYYQDISGTLSVVAATDDTTLVTNGKVNDSIFIQKLHIEVTAGAAGRTWTFKDSAGTPVNIVPSVDASAIAHFDFDFGPNGVPCTAAKDFLLDVSSAGAAGWISWEGYQKRTVVGAP